MSAPKFCRCFSSQLRTDMFGGLPAVSILIYKCMFYKKFVQIKIFANRLKYLVNMLIVHIFPSFLFKLLTFAS